MNILILILCLSLFLNFILLLLIRSIIKKHKKTYKIESGFERYLEPAFKRTKRK